jgi:hypothetical protein
MLWTLLGTACVIYTVYELRRLRKLRAVHSGRGRSPQTPPRPDPARPPTPAGEPEVQFGDVDPPAPPVTLDRRTRHDPYLAQLKRRTTDR